MRRRTVGGILAATILVASGALAADPREQQLAQALFDEARQLMEQQRYAEACPKLVESQRLDPGGGTLLNLALCHEKEGKIASAHAEYHEALSTAIRDGRTDRQDLARERIAAIDRKIPRVTVVVSGAADVEGLEVKLDGLVLRRAAWGIATPADPGQHRVEATAPGRKAWSASFSVQGPEKKTIEIPVLDGLDPLGPGAPSVVPMVTPATVPTGAAAPEAPTVSMKPNPLFYVAVGVTAVSAAASAATGILALQANATANDGCLPDRHFCANQDALDAAHRARTLAWVSTGTMALALAGGVSLLFIPTTARATTQVGVVTLPGGGGFRVLRTF